MKKGTKHTLESIRKMEESHKGYVAWNKGTKGVMKAWNKGIKIGPLSEITRQKMSYSRKGKKFSDIHKKKIADSLQENKNALNHHWNWTEESKERFRGKYVGKLSSNWQGGISFYPYPMEFNQQLKREAKERDLHECQLCRSKKRLAIHHIDGNKSNSDFDNLITLCISCHMKQHNKQKREFWKNYWKRRLNDYNQTPQVGEGIV